MRSASVLVVDDEAAVAEEHARLLRGLGHRAAIETDPAKAEARLAGEPAIELVLLDLRLPGIDGLELLRRIRVSRPDVGVILATVVNDVETAVRAIQSGAYNYLLKPLRAESLGRALESCLSNRPEGLVEDPRFSAFVTRDPAFREVFRRLAAFAAQDVPVLIQGETGTGKELAAQLTHALSPRGREPFLAVNLASFPPTLFESELFGHVRGAFTGATRDRAGRFEEAGAGTLFLDEIGELGLDAQSKLLRAIQERRYSRVGESAERPLRARLVLATNRDLKEAVEEGLFREDLYYRVSGYLVTLPPLRERTGDVEVLAGYFLRKYASQYGRPVERLSSGALELLRGYPFPGNVRELESVISSALLLEPSRELTAESLPRHLAAASPAEAGDLERARFEAVRKALAENGGNQTRAAARLKIARQTLNVLLKRYRERGWIS